MKKILMATDGSEHSEKTIGETIKLAGTLEAEVTVITVMDEPPNLAYIVPSDTIKKIKENYKENSQQILARTEKIFKENGIEVKTVLANGHAAEEICNLANGGEFDMVVLGSRGLGGLQEVFLGSVSSKVAHCAKTHILIIK